MPFNGSGIFNRVYSWAQDAANAIDITASRVDTEDTGFATGLTLCVTRDGQGPMAADFLPNAAGTLNLGTAAVPWASVNVTGPIAGKCVPIFKTKAATTSRVVTITLADDPDLVSGTLGLGTYEFKMALFVTGSGTTAQGFKYQPLFTGTSVFCYTETGSTNGVAVPCPNAFTLSTTSSHANVLGDTGAGTSTDFVRMEGSMTVTVAGVFKLQWAQFNSSGNATNLKAGSYLSIAQIV